MNFRFYDVIENGLLEYYFPFIFLLVFRVVRMQEFILLNYCKIMLVKIISSFFSNQFLTIKYLAFYSIIIAVFFEAIAVSWLYGIKRISEDVKQMLGSKPGRFWLGTWCIAAPVFLGVKNKNLIL